MTSGDQDQTPDRAPLSGPRRLALEPDARWLAGVARVPSPNCDPRPAGCGIDLLLVHGISLPPGQYGGPGIDELFTNRLDPAAHPYYAALAGLRVSAHVLIRRDGTLTQYVPFHLRAWHAGESCHQGREACNDFSIGVELEGVDDVAYPGIQYRRLAELASTLMAGWPRITPERVVGHCHVAPGRKTDPGAAFDWDRLRRLLEGARPPPGP